MRHLSLILKNKRQLRNNLETHTMLRSSWKIQVVLFQIIEPYSLHWTRSAHADQWEQSHVVDYK